MSPTQSKWTKIMVLGLVNCPIIYGVAPLALRTAPAIVHIRMAPCTIDREADVLIPNMTCGAFQTGMRPNKGITRLLSVVEIIHGRPRLWRMAFNTGLIELRRVEVRMTVSTRRINGSVVTILVAAFAGNLSMLTFKFEA